MFGNAKIQNSIVWRSQNSQFRCLEKEKSRIPMFGKAKLHMRSSILTKCLPPYIIEWIVVSFHIEEHNRNNRVAQTCPLSNFSPEKRSDHLATRETADYFLFSGKNRYINKTHMRTQSRAENSLYQFCLTITTPFSPFYLKEMKNY